MKKNDFFDQYKDPRWQKKRLEIMERDEFKCVSCQDSESTLNIHHCVPYRKDTKPWDYKNDELTTLCESCHNNITETIETCRLIIMGRCWCIDSAMEMLKILIQIDGMNPYELNAIWKLIIEAKKI